MKIDRVKGLICALILAVSAMYGFVNHPAGKEAVYAGSDIGAITREDGSGTREAFTQLFDIKQKQEDGRLFDQTSPHAAVTNSTSVILSSVASDPTAVGYISMGSLNNSVKALSIDGIMPTSSSVMDGTYKITRSFNLVVKDELSAPANDFIRFILSKEGQEIPLQERYIPVENTGSYKKEEVKGKVSVSGSSSVSPLMEKMAESYEQINPNVEIEIQPSDSSSGIANAYKGLSDIGMSSREIKEEETNYDLKTIPIAKDAIVLIVNKDNAIHDLSSQEVQAIYTGKIKTWKEVE